MPIPVKPVVPRMYVSVQMVHLPREFHVQLITQIFVRDVIWGTAGSCHLAFKIYVSVHMVHPSGEVHVQFMTKIIVVVVIEDTRSEVKIVSLGVVDATTER